MQRQRGWFRLKTNHTTLLTSQRNQLFKELIKKGLQPSDFTEDSGNDWYILRLASLHNELRFEIERKSKQSGNNAYVIKRLPGYSGQPDAPTSINSDGWDGAYHSPVVAKFRDWAASVKREIDAPDLWLEATKAVQLFEPATEPAADKFTIAELGALHGQLRMLEQLFKNSELLREFQTEMVELTQTAAVKAETFTKKDWQNWVKGAFVSAIVSLELSEAQAQELLALVRLAFGGLFLNH